MNGDAPQPLDYEPPAAPAERSRRRRDFLSVHDTALVFAALGVIIACLSAISGKGLLDRAATKKGQAARQDSREAAHRMFAISALTGVSAVGLGVFGIRGPRR